MWLSLIYMYSILVQFVYTLHQKTETNIVELSNQYGINIIHEDSEEELKANIHGGYRPDTYEIVLYNIDYLNSINRYDLTLKHEFIHAIQHCRGKRTRFVNLLNTISFRKCLYNDRIDIEYINDFYPKEDWLIEVEAYCLENIISYQDINELLSKYCGNFSKSIFV